MGGFWKAPYRVLTPPISHTEIESTFSLMEVIGIFPLITVSLKWNTRNIATMIVKSHIYYPPLLCAGETIELLDIGLRHSKDHIAVHRVKPSMSTHRFSVTSPSKSLYGSGASKSTMTLLHYIRDSAETINLRGSQDSSVELSPAPPPPPPPPSTSQLICSSQWDIFCWKQPTSSVLTR